MALFGQNPIWAGVLARYDSKPATGRLADPAGRWMGRDDHRARVASPVPAGVRRAHARVRLVHRWVALLVLAACEPTAPTGDDPDARAAPSVTWIVPPAPGGFPLGAIKGRLGRS